MQISDDLIQYITNELMKRLERQPEILSAAAKPLLHLVGRREDFSTPALARIQESFDVREHTRYEDELPPSARVLLSSLGLQALTRVAEGDEGCTIEGRVLLSALLNGQPVAALRDGLLWRRYQASAPRGLLLRYQHCERVLRDYGLKLVDEDEVVEALSGQAPKFPASPAPPQAAAAFKRPAGGRKVLTEAELMKLCPLSGGEGQSLRLSPGDILTPLAQDYVSALKIKLLKD